MAKNSQILGTGLYVINAVLEYVRLACQNIRVNTLLVGINVVVVLLGR